VLVAVLHATLPDYNASGQCSGLGFGCTLTPADLVLFLGYFAAPVLFVLGLVACVLIAFVQSRRQRREAPEPPMTTSE
jgi:ABC-type Na+ efflux pump permease subunit